MRNYILLHLYLFAPLILNLIIILPPRRHVIDGAMTRVDGMMSRGYFVM